MEEPEGPVGEVEGPGLGDGRWSGGHPHCAAEDFGGVGGVAGDVEEAVLDTPVAAEGERDAIASKGDLFGWKSMGVFCGGRMEGERTFERSG